MENVLTYKGYFGLVKYNPEDELLHGRIEGIVDLVTFEGASVVELKRAFEEAVDDYLLTCEQLGKSPNKPYSGGFNVRLPVELHRQAALLSKQRGISLNQLVIDAVRQHLQ